MKLEADDFFGFAEYARNASGRWALRPKWKRIFAAACMLGVVSYFVLVGFLYWREHEIRGLDETRFSEILAYPFFEDVRKTQRKRYSAALIAEAKQKKDPREVWESVLNGLRQDATHPDGRIFYSYVLFLQRRPRAALEFLRDGLENVLSHPEYVRFFSRQCLSHFEDALLIETADAFASHENISPQNRFVLCASAAQAEIFLGRFEAAKKRLQNAPLAGTSSAVFLSACIARECGDTRRATEMLLSLRDRVKSVDLEVALARDFFVLGEKERALRHLVFAEALSEKSPSARVRVLAELFRFDWTDAERMREKLTADFFRRFGKDPSAMSGFCTVAAEHGDWACVERCRAIAEAHAFPNFSEFVLMHVETLLRCGKISEARRELDEIFREKPNWVADNEAILNGLRAVAFFADGEEALGEIFLQNARTNAQLTVSQTIALARALDDCGQAIPAFRLLEKRFEIDPEHPSLLCAILDFCVRKNDAEAFARYAPKLEDSRRPERALLQRILEFSQGDRFLFRDIKVLYGKEEF